MLKSFSGRVSQQLPLLKFSARVKNILKHIKVRVKAPYDFWQLLAQRLHQHPTELLDFVVRRPAIPTHRALKQSWRVRDGADTTILGRALCAVAGYLLRRRKSVPQPQRRCLVVSAVPAGHNGQSLLFDAACVSLLRFARRLAVVNGVVVRKRLKILRGQVIRLTSSDPKSKTPSL